MLKKPYLDDRRALRELIKLCLVLNMIMLVSLLGVGTYALFKGKNDRILLIPPGISTENAVQSGIWTEGDSLGPAYIERMGLYFIGQLLTYQPERAKHQFTRALYDMNPALASHIKPKLMADANRIVKYGMTSVFLPQDTLVEKNEVFVTGELSIFNADKLYKREPKTFRVRFTVVAGRVVVARYDEVDRKVPKKTTVVKQDSGENPNPVENADSNVPRASKEMGDLGDE